MDLPLRTRLIAAFAGVVLLAGALTTLAGSFLINRMVIGEAERRVVLALKTAHAMLERRLEEAQKACMVMAGGNLAEGLASQNTIDPLTLNDLRTKCGYDFLHILDSGGNILAEQSGSSKGAVVLTSPVVASVFLKKEPASGICLLPLEALNTENETLAARMQIRVLPTPHAKPGGPQELTEAMVLEAAAPIMNRDQEIKGIVRVGTLLNQNFDFVDFVRENVFTVTTYQGKNLGTVTIFQGDVRITTNVIGPNGRRAVGTRVSEEVYDHVLGRGETWTGPAFVVDSWYISAYEPLRNIKDETVGMLYVGVLKKRYDDMRNQVMTLFIVIAILVLLCAVFLSYWLAARLARPLSQLTAAAAEVTKGNLDYQLSQTPRGEKDEINRLTRAFNQMVNSLKERNEQLQRSRDDVQRTATELQQMVQNYLEALEFITHELKNQIAAMKINLLAVRDGYVGEIREDQREALDDVGRAINRAEVMMLNYLNLSRIEKGELEVHTRPVHIETEIIRPVLSNFQAQLEGKEMQVLVDIQEDLLVEADPSLLQIVYENLLSNAAKYGRKSGEVRLFGKCEGGNAILHVWNDGPGVPAQQMNKLFKRFSRLQPPTNIGQERGTGLGLFITRVIVRRHGGEIHAEGTYNSWIDFVLRLPLPNNSLENNHQ